MKTTLKNVLFAWAMALGSSAVANDSSTLEIEGTSCSLCAAGLNKSLKKMDEVQDVKVDLDSKKIFITTKDGKALPQDKVNELINSHGFNVKK